MHCTKVLADAAVPKQHGGMKNPGDDPFQPDVSAGTTAERLAARGPSALAARNAALALMASQHFDVLVIGGGISGAGVAREAALAGYKTALIERGDFASGTSSRSSRLIHGGVRYLEHGYLSLVFEASRERRLLLKLAPHLVRPLSFTWPVYRGSRLPRWKVRAGLALYDVLSVFRNVGRHRPLSTNAVLRYEPALGREGLLGGARYWDAATDDSRLTLAAALGARDAGAIIANHLEVISAIHAPSGRLTGVRVHDHIDGAEFVVSGTIVVNATGPWSESTAAVTATQGTKTEKQILGSAGTHIAVPRQRIGNRDAVTIVSPLDGRVMFVLPAGPHAIIGTTEHAAPHGPDEIRASQQDVSYLLRTANLIFPHAKLTLDDVITGWAGIRPLAASRAGTKGAGSASREHAVTSRSDGLITLTGGKLTTFRAMAADVMKHVLASARNNGTPLKASVVAQSSDSTPLPGGDIRSLDQLKREAAETTRDSAVGERLASAYGSNWRNVWSYAQRDPSLGKRLIPDLPYLTAEVAHAVEREMACTIADVLIRRTHVAFETRDNGRSAARRVAPLVGALHGWSEEETASQIDAYDRESRRIFTIESPDSDTAKDV